MGQFESMCLFQFDGKQVIRKCYKAIKHDDGDIIQIKDCILVCSGARYRDMPYVAKVTNFWEEPNSGTYIRI